MKRLEVESDDLRVNFDCQKDGKGYVVEINKIELYSETIMNWIDVSNLEDKTLTTMVNSLVNDCIERNEHE